MNKRQWLASVALALGSQCLTTGHAAELGSAVMPETTVFSPSLRFEGKVVDRMADGKALREVAYLRGRKFVWEARIDGRIATPEAAGRVDMAVLADEHLTREQLADNLRGLALFNGHQYREAESAFDLADEAIRLRELERTGALAKQPLGRSPAQGNARYNLLQEDKPTQQGGAIGINSVHGTVDDRSVMANTTYPYRTNIVFDNAGSTGVINSSQGSGTLIGPSTAMSVAHVFWNEDGDTWEADHRWSPGFDSADADPSPYGEWYRCYWVTIPTAYTNGNSATHDYAVLDFDVGCDSISNGVNSDEPGATVGWLGHYTASESAIEDTTGYVRGYPGTGTCGNPGVSCATRIWGDTSSSSETNATSTTIEHMADTSGGQSGSAFYHYADPTCTGCGYGAYLVGMHRAGTSSYNLARRFDSTVYSFMKAYSSDY